MVGSKGGDGGLQDTKKNSRAAGISGISTGVTVKEERYSRSEIQTVGSVSQIYRQQIQQLRNTENIFSIINREQ